MANEPSKSTQTVPLRDSFNGAEKLQKSFNGASNLKPQPQPQPIASTAVPAASAPATLPSRTSQIPGNSGK